MSEQRKSPSRRSLLVGAALIVLVLAAGLALDLANHGLAWRVMGSLTGEEAPISQLLGMIDWLGSFTREQPQTAPDVPIQHVGVNPYGINTFLEQEVEPAKRERQVQMITEAGFHWIRQEIPWQDIEIDARGDFQDRRNESAIGIIDAWAKYDQIVDLVEQYGLELQARIDKPPAWTHAVPDTLGYTPPDNWDDYINFLTVFAERYKGRIHYYQIWNEPNIYPEWGDNPVNPEEYTQVLCRASAALKAVDPANVVISAALSPTVSLTSRDLNEFIFLQRMYDAGAQGCFDVMATQGYGFFSGPTDQRMRPTNSSFARSLYLRDLMVRNGDAGTPIWISEAAWNPVDSPEVPEMPLKEQFGSVTQEQAARYMPLAYDRAQREWPWVGVINYWFFKRPSTDDQNQPYYYFRMVEPDFTPLPVYDAMKQHIASSAPTLYAGVHQADDWALQPGADGRLIAMHMALSGQALQAREVTFSYSGTGFSLRWIGLMGDKLKISVDGGEPVTSLAPTLSPHENEVTPLLWTETPVTEALTAATHTVRLSAETPFLLESVTVYDSTRPHLTPIVAGGVALGLLALGGLGWALWKRMSQ